MPFSTRCVLAPNFSNRSLDALQLALDAGDVHSFALGGPTPATTALHLALDHLRSFSIAEWPSQDVDDSEDEERPISELGATTADPKPVSRPRERPSVLIIARSREDWHWALTDQSDVWLARHGGDRAVVNLLRQVQIRFCPTYAHAHMVLSSLAIGPILPEGQPTQLFLPAWPTLVVLYDIVPYFDEPRFARANTSAFSALLSLAVDTARFCTAQRQALFAGASIQPTQLAILDPQLFNKRLPTLPPLTARRTNPTSSPGTSSPARSDNRPGSDRTLDLASVAEWFVDVLGRFDAEPLPESMADADEDPDSILRLTALTWWRSARKALPDGASDDPRTVRLEVKHDERGAVPFSWRSSTNVLALF